MKEKVIKIKPFRNHNVSILEENLKKIIEEIRITKFSDKTPDIRKIYISGKKYNPNLQRIYSAITTAGYSILTPREY